MGSELNTSPITIRFRKWPGPVGEEQHFFRKLFEIVTGRGVVFVESELGDVDIEIESVYGERQIPSLNSLSAIRRASNLISFNSSCESFRSNGASCS